MLKQLTSQEQLQHQVDQIAKELNEGATCEDCGETMSGFDYIEDVLDIQYIISSKKEFLGSRILVAFGGPNIWINTQTKTVEGYWWGDKAFASYYNDEMDIEGAVQELWDCIA